MNDQDVLGPRLELGPDRRVGRTIAMRGAVIQIGRDPTSDIHFEDSHISRQHARIERHPDGAFYLCRYQQASGDVPQRAED